MQLLHIDHFTLRVPPAALAPLCDFYTRVLGLVDGARPAFAFPGHWLYAGAGAVVHLAGSVGAQVPPAAPTGRLDHISLRAQGLADTRAHLASHGVPWSEAEVPGAPLHQVFLHDPTGLRIELTFDSAELVSAGHLTQQDARVGAD